MRLTVHWEVKGRTGWVAMDVGVDATIQVIFDDIKHAISRSLRDVKPEVLDRLVLFQEKEGPKVDMDKTFMAVFGPTIESVVLHADYDRRRSTRK